MALVVAAEGEEFVVLRLEDSVRGSALGKDNIPSFELSARDHVDFQLAETVLAIAALAVLIAAEADELILMRI